VWKASLLVGQVVEWEHNMGCRGRIQTQAVEQEQQMVKEDDRWVWEEHHMV
jgi:hypothetical protein